ncbi:copper oxidase [Roseisolibacter sp. H3M3-2]|uniref:multicopper oxidase family protein n=1 Tax=Roseisolibacter sp. H3M3-2 TaxID=3031323 RepID=UPI0023DAD552|nr:copper oxidase [Roseisolibacter sp. H3M3-2]MDF1503884.1 copper oxidase [Roseisolibacter sp. H3M3-2]
MSADTIADRLRQQIATATSRRAFLRQAGLATAAVGATGALAACAQGDAAQANQATPGGAADHSGGAMAARPAPAAPAPGGEGVYGGLTLEQARARADAMDAMHEKGVKAFPAKTQGMGNQVLDPRLDKGVKVFELTARPMKWETEPGKFVYAWAYNEQVPGPQIRVTEGDRVRVVIKNELPESTAIHFHGVVLPIAQDGVPFITQPPVKPGESYTYEFTAKNAGSHMYHSHINAAKQVGSGLLGAFIIEPKRPRAIEKVDVDYVMVLNDGVHGYTLNGKGFPATEPIKAKLGQKVRVRFMNEGMMIHPMHLHGMPMTVIDKDGWAQPAPWKCDTLNIAPGERWDVVIDCDNPGVWAFHCHILPHAEGEHGMFGMVTALIVEK